MWNVLTFSAQLARAAEAEDVELMKAASDELIRHLGDVDSLEEDVFQAILCIIRGPGFLSMEGGWHLLQALWLEWECLSEGQMQLLISTLEDTYPLYQDWMSCFTISETIGERLGDKPGLDVLARLRMVEREMPRSFVPHGLEHLLISCEDGEVCRSALSLLCEMRDDPSEKVRYEVELSLARLASRGIGGPHTT
jgi:hypothetical protein